MPSIHAVRWIENLSDTNHELYWFDVLGRGNLPTKISIKQIVNWNKRKIPYIKGEYFLRKKVPSLYFKMQPYLEVTANEKLFQIINEIKPDLIHSFEMQSCSYPILKTMNTFPALKWLYSCWGSDLFYYQNKSQHLHKIKAVLNRIDFLHTDCERDFIVAKELDFAGRHVGVIPGGGGFYLEKMTHFIKPFSERKIILVKGYQHHVGRGLVLVKALHSMQSKIQEKGFEVVVFGAHQVTKDYITMNNLSYKVFSRHGLAHQDLLQLMGKSLLYLGNSISDGMPNTLLEAITMGAFPIQSNPGNVTAEIVTHGKNGLLIENPNDQNKISNLIQEAIENNELLENAFELNLQIAKERLEYRINQQKILDLYQQIENEL